MGVQEVLSYFLHTHRKVVFMNSAHENIIKNNLEKIAKSEGITTDEVRQEIALAISYALKSDDPKVQNFWKDIPCEGDTPTVDEVIDYIATQLIKERK